MTVLLLVALLAAAGCRAGRQPASPAGGVAAVKLLVDADGAYDVTARGLAAAGFDLATADPQDLELSAGGQPIPFLLVGQGKDRSLRFYGQALDSPPAAVHNVYWLTRRLAAQNRLPAPLFMAVQPATPDSRAVLSEVVSATVRLEEQRQYVATVGPGDDPWLWASILAPAEIKVQIPIVQPASGEARLRVRVWGASSAAVNPDHHLTLTLNAVPVADARWDGLGAHIITATAPAGLLRSGDNQLVLAAAGDTGAPADVVLLDWVEVNYPRKLVADEARLEFEGQATGYAARISADGLRSQEPVAALWDITNPQRPIALRDYRVASGLVRFSVPPDAHGPRRFLLATQSGLRQPIAIIPAAGPLAADRLPAGGPAAALRAWPGGADLIIVTVPQFREALQPLIAARTAAGLRVALVDVGDVYDAFSFGRGDPAAIRALAQHARTAWAPPAPRFLLLAGDASYDPRGYLKGPEVDLIPTRLIETAHTGRTASDVWFALPDDSPTSRPALAVGRLPAQTVEQMKTMVAKTLSYPAASASGDSAWRARAFLLADGSDPSFQTEASAFATGLPGYETQVIASTGDGVQARAALLRAFADGIGLVGYFGHGSLSQWTKEKAFGSGDALKLTNRERLPIVFTLTCLSGFFQHPSTPSLGEILLRNAGGGAVAAIVPSSAAVLEDQRLLARELARGLSANDTNQRTLGEILLQAQTALPVTHPGAREILLTFNLLGDPSLPVAR
jgi:hypothetical protein